MYNKNGFMNHNRFLKRRSYLAVMTCCLILSSCSIITAPYKITKGVMKSTVWLVKGTYEFTAGTTRLLYKIGEYTFEVAKAPLDWPLINKDIEKIDGLSPKDAIRLGRVKNSPYIVNGKTYKPMSVEEAENYSETGIASWYGYETIKKGGYMTANGEVFNPDGLTGAHKYLPLPIHVKVTNLENNRSIIVRVNDRGPFACEENPDAEKRVIDLSRGAAKKLGFYEKGTARVKIEVISLKEG